MKYNLGILWVTKYSWTSINRHLSTTAPFLSWLTVDTFTLIITSLYNGHLYTTATATKACLNCQNNFLTMARQSLTDERCKRFFFIVKEHKTRFVPCVFGLRFCLVSVKSILIVFFISMLQKAFFKNMLHPPKQAIIVILHSYVPIMATLLQRPLPFVPKMAVVERSDVKYMWYIGIILFSFPHKRVPFIGLFMVMHN